MNGAACRQAIVLAAGRGSRLGALTDDRPKCLCEIAGRPILDWTTDALRANGIERILIVAGWQAHALRQRRDTVRVNAEWAAGNMVSSLLCAADWLEREATLIVYGDGAYGTRAMAAALRPSPHDILVPIDTEWLRLWQLRFPDPLADAETLIRSGDRLLEIGRRAPSLAQIQGQFMGMVRTTPQGWLRIAACIDDIGRNAGEVAVRRLDTTALLNALIVSGEPVHCVAVDGGWVEIDSLQDLESVEAALEAVDFCHDFRC